MDGGLYERILDAIKIGRRDQLTPRVAARRAGTTLGTLRRHGDDAIERRGRRWFFTDVDHLPRAMNALTDAGPEPVVVRDSAKASLLGMHANAVRWYLETGSTDRLETLPATSVEIDGVVYDLAVDPDILDRLALGHELEFDPYRYR
jgi:hypothetical protein